MTEQERKDLIIKMDLDNLMARNAERARIRFLNQPITVASKSHYNPVFKTLKQNGVDKEIREAVHFNGTDWKILLHTQIPLTCFRCNDEIQENEIFRTVEQGHEHIKCFNAAQAST